MAIVLMHSTRLGINHVYDDGDNADDGGDRDGGGKVIGMIMMTTTHFW